MRLVAVACLAWGCSFERSAAPTPDGGDTDAAPIAGDAPSACTIAAVGVATEAPALGGAGGSPQADIVCAGLPIGLGFDVSSDPISNHNDQVAMVNLHVRCGTLVRGDDAIVRTAPANLVSSTGGNGGNCSAYFPTEVAAEVLCPSGSVLVGLAGNRLDDTLYNTVSIVCAAIGADNLPSATTTTFPVAGTGAESNQPQASACPPNTAITSFAVRSGCGHDALVPRCAPLACN